MEVLKSILRKVSADDLDRIYAKPQTIFGDDGAEPRIVVSSELEQMHEFCAEERDKAENA